MTAIAHHLADSLPIRHETRVVLLERVDQSWQVTDSMGQLHGLFQHVIVSLPAPQAADLLEGHTFAAELRAIPMTPCWAVLAAFERRIESAWDGAFVHGSPLSWVARNSSKPGRDCSTECWVLHGSPAWSAAHRDLARDTVQATLLDAFGKLTASSMFSPIHIDDHRWLFSATPRSLDRLVFSDDPTGLVVCGDWLAGGRVEGAFRSGVAAADCILRQRDLTADKFPPRPSQARRTET